MIYFVPGPGFVPLVEPVGWSAGWRLLTSVRPPAVCLSGWPTACLASCPSIRWQVKQSSEGASSQFVKNVSNELGRIQHSSLEGPLEGTAAAAPPKILAAANLLRNSRPGQSLS